MAQQRGPSDSPTTTTTVRTPHVDTLVAALMARDLPYSVTAPNVVEVRDIAPDDLGWLAAAAGVVVYEMVTHPSAPERSAELGT